MPQLRGRPIGLLTAVLAAASLTFAVAAPGSRGGDDRRDARGHRDSGRDLLRASLVGSLPTDPAINGVTPGGAPWVIDRGKVRLRADGRLRLRVEGLVIPPPRGTNTAGGVTTITASVFCAGATTAAATSGAVALTQSGDARIDQRLTLSGACLAPVVLVHPNGAAARYIAVSGFGR
jgi:hypothetical protein